MADIQSKISYDTTGAVSSINALTAALKNYNAAASKPTKGSNAKSATKDAKAHSQALTESGKAASKADKAAATYYKNASAGAKKLTANTKKAADANKGFLISWESLARIGFMQVLHTAVSSITAGIRNATTAAIELGIALGEIQTISPQFDNFDELSNKIKELSNLSGLEIKDVASGMYQTLSNQVTEAGHSFEFLQTAADLAIAGVGSLEGSVNLLSSTLNSYGKSASEAGKISDELFKAVELGRFKISDIANIYGRVAGLAATLGVKTAELAASMAALTSTGMPANEAMTLINNVMLKLIKPTKGLKKVFDELGIATAEAGVQIYGFQGFLDKITEKGGKTASELGKLFGRVRAIRGALGLTVTVGDKYKKILEEIENASGATAKALAKIQDTDAKKLKDEYNKAKNTMLAFGDAINKNILYMIKMTGGIEGLGAALGALIGAAAGVAAGLAAIALIANPLALAIAAITAAMMVGSVAYNAAANAAEDSAERQAAAWKAAQEAFVEARNAEISLNAEVGRSVLTQSLKELQERAIKVMEIAEKTKTLQDISLGGVTDEVGIQIDSVSKYFDLLDSQVAKAAQTLTELPGKIRAVKDNIADFKFEVKLEGLDGVKKFNALLKKSRDLQREAKQASAAGDSARASSLQKESVAMAKRARGQAKSIDSTRLEKRARNEVVDAMKLEKRLLNENARQQADNAAKIKATSADRKAQARELKSLEKQIAEERKKIDPGMSDDDAAKVAKRLQELGDKQTKLIEKIKEDSKGLLDGLSFEDKAKGFGLLTEASGQMTSRITGDVVTFGTAYTQVLSNLQAKWKQLGLVALGELTAIKEFGLEGGTGEEAMGTLTELTQQTHKYEKSAKAVAQAEVDKSNALEKALANYDVLLTKLPEAIAKERELALAAEAGSPEHGTAVKRLSALQQLKSLIGDTIESFKQQEAAGTLSATKIAEGVSKISDVIQPLVGETENVVDQAAAKLSGFVPEQEVKASVGSVIGAFKDWIGAIKTVAKNADLLEEATAFEAKLDLAAYNKQSEDFKEDIKKIKKESPVEVEVKTLTRKDALKKFVDEVVNKGKEATKKTNEELKEIGEPIPKAIEKAAKKSAEVLKKGLKDVEVKIEALNDVTPGVEAAKKELDSISDKTVKVKSDTSGLAGTTQAAAQAGTEAGEAFYDKYSNAGGYDKGSIQQVDFERQPDGGDSGVSYRKPHPSGFQPGIPEGQLIRLSAEGKIIKDNTQLYKEYQDLLNTKRARGDTPWPHEMEQLEKLKSKAEEGIKLNVDGSQAEQETSKVKDNVNGIEDKDIKLDASGNAKQEAEDVSQKTDGLQDKTLQINATGNSLAMTMLVQSALGGLPPNKDIDVSVKGNAKQEVDSVKQKTEALQDKTINVNAQNQSAFTLDSVKTKLESLVDKIVNVNVNADTSQVSLLKNLLSSIADKQVTISTLVNDYSALYPLQAAIDALRGKTVTVKANVSGEAAVRSLIASIAALHDKTVTITTIQKTVCVSVGCSGGSGGGSSSGSGAGAASSSFGRLFRADGGEARGTDTIPAMLTPGEFVINAKTSRNMFSQLVAANAKSHYLGSNDNSTTFNNNFNISGSDAPQQTAREIQKLLRRENRIRR